MNFNDFRVEYYRHFFILLIVQPTAAAAPWA